MRAYLCVPANRSPWFPSKKTGSNHRGTACPPYDFALRPIAFGRRVGRRETQRKTKGPSRAVPHAPTRSIAGHWKPYSVRSRGPGYGPRISRDLFRSSVPLWFKSFFATAANQTAVTTVPPIGRRRGSVSLREARGAGPSNPARGSARVGPWDPNVRATQATSKPVEAIRGPGGLGKVPARGRATVEQQDPRYANQPAAPFRSADVLKINEYIINYNYLVDI